MSIGFFHTLLGPDHTLPFIVMSKANGWSLRKTMGITVCCGIGHIASSVVIGILGLIAGFALDDLVVFEQNRGSIAAWGLLSFGILYTLWGIKKARSFHSHTHEHHHQDGVFHTHCHNHVGHEHHHVHHTSTASKAMTPWVLFIIFVFGPCEPLIPVLMFPAVQQHISVLILVTIVFGFTTLLTMVSVVMLGRWGLQTASVQRLDRFAHATAGMVVMIAGFGMVFLGW